MRRTPSLLAVAAFTLVASSAAGATLSVGPGKTYAAPCAAFAAAADGDTIEIDATGSYVGDVCAVTHSLTIRGVGGRPKIDAGGTASGGKAIWVVQGADTTIENVEMFGCSVPDMNGAAIRIEGMKLVLRKVFFHDNEDGILGGPPGATVWIEDSEFANNGAGDGYSHNMYINEIASFTLIGSWSHGSKVGHLVKTRALENHILYNRITDETGTGSYEIDVPQAGNTWIVGNMIEQSPTTENPAIITWGEESTKNPGRDVFIVNNTIVNDLGKGTFIHIGGGVTTPAIVRNNVFVGTGTACDQAGATMDTNYVGDPGLVDPAGYDYHLKSGSTAVDKGAAPGTGDGVSLTPECQYVHPASAFVRNVVGVIDQGAFELGGESTTPCAGGTTPGDAGSDGGTTMDSGSAKDSATTGDGSPAADSSITPGGDSGGDGGAADSGTGSSGGCGCSLPGAVDGATSWSSSTLSLLALLLLRRRGRR